MKRLQNPVILLWLILSLAVLVFSGCQAARKPADPERVVVPEVTKIFFERKDVAQAPPVVRDLADRFAGQDAHFALQADGGVWIVATSEDDDDVLSIKEVIQRVVNQNTTILEIRLQEQENKNKKNNDDDKVGEPLIARLNTNDLASGPVFYLDEDENEAEEKQTEAKESTPSATPAPATPVNRADRPVEKKTEPPRQPIEVETPKPEEKVSSPVDVSGVAKGISGAVKVRLRDGEGNILAETETVASQNGGSFKAKLTYEKPENPVQGRLEIFSVQNGQEKNMKVIPLTIQ